VIADPMPFCYRENSFWVRKPDPIFALRNSAKTDEGLNPTVLYYPDVFVWLPHTIDRRPLTCQNKNCSRYQDSEKRLKDKGWPDTPIARKVIGLECNYYIMTKRFYCQKDVSGGCGQSWMLYHPDILKQLEPALADRFPAFLTHRSAIDKTLLALIRAGIAHHVSSSAWEEILRELHVREHDIRELWYLQSIQHEKMLDAKYQRPLKQYRPFSAFNNKSQYAGYSPSQKFITNVYLDFMENIRACLDQCVSALPGLILQWDHSFKVPLYMMRLNGIKIFVALFTVLNEFGQIRFQAFVPTKSLVHIRAGMEAIVKSLEDHGHPQPILGFTDNVGADMRTFMECIPSLGKSVKLVDPSGLFSHLPQMELPPNVSRIFCKTTLEIETACCGILDLLGPESNVTSTINLGFDMEWEYSTGVGGTGSRKTAIIQLALPDSVYLLRVYSLEKLPGPLESVLRSKRIVKIGRNIGADFSKLVRDFKGFCTPNKTGNQYEGVIELGSLAKQKQITSNANASLSTLVAAVFQKNLSKEIRSSEWGSVILTEEQTHYAALDAWVALHLYNQIRVLPDTGIPLTAATHVGQLVSLFVRQQEVARGKIVEQPENINIRQSLQGQIKDININIRRTKTRALIEIFEVLAPACVVAHHRMSLSNIQNGQEKFLAVVSISSLRSYTPRLNVMSEQIIPNLPKNMGHPTLIQPPQIPDFVQSTIEHSDLIQSGIAITEVDDDMADQFIDDSEDDMADQFIDDSEDEIDQNTQESNTAVVEELPAFTQGTSEEHDTRILADIFHEIQKVTKTISRRHSLHKRFAAAFSDTLLIPDETDKKAVESVLAKQNIDWNTKRAKDPDWLWKRVRRYIPRKEVLHPILKEFFECWGKVICSVHKIPLFNEESWKKANAVLQDVQRGWLSDPESIPLYVVNGSDQNGLTVYHCLRGTNSVEGAIHNPIWRAFAALKASPELADALTADYRHRHNTKAESRHRQNTVYKGHFDPWLLHAIQEIRGDIQWTEPPPSNNGSMTTTDPLSFTTSSEQFGITRIPPEVRSDMHFGGSPTYEEHSIQMSSYFVELLSMSRLSGRTKNVYDYLASMQGTQYAVVPLHTKEEYELFHSSVKSGGEWSAAVTKPNFSAMAKWWSGKAKGMENSVFYKLPEHLEHYYGIWDQYRKTRQTMIDSQAQRQPNHDRTHAASYIAKTLPAAHHSQPGILQQLGDTPEVPDQSYMNENSEEHFDPEFAYSRSASPPLLEQFSTNVDVSMMAPLPPFKKRQFKDLFGEDSNEQSMFSSRLNDQTQINSMSGYQQMPLMYQAGGSHFTSGTYAENQALQIVHWKNDNAKRQRKCGVCGNYGCPGENNRSRCENQVCLCSLNYNSIFLD
jgi:hypothetical protein